MSAINRVLVVGATGGSGRATVDALLEKGLQVTAFARHADALAGRSDRLETINGDAMNRGDISAAVKGHDAVVVTDTRAHIIINDVTIVHQRADVWWAGIHLVHGLLDVALTVS